MYIDHCETSSVIPGVFRLNTCRDKIKLESITTRHSGNLLAGIQENEMSSQQRYAFLQTKETALFM